MRRNCGHADRERAPPAPVPASQLGARPWRSSLITGKSARWRPPTSQCLGRADSAGICASVRPLSTVAMTSCPPRSTAVPGTVTEQLTPARPRHRRTAAKTLNTPSTNARATRPLRPPGKRHDLPSRRATNADPRPTQRPHAKPEHAAAAARPWPSVKQPTVRTDRPGARIPSAMRPWTPQHRGLQRDKVTQHETQKKRPA